MLTCPHLFNLTSGKSCFCITPPIKYVSLLHVKFIDIYCRLKSSKIFFAHQKGVGLVYVEGKRRRLGVFEIRKCGGWQREHRWKGSALPEWRPVTTNGHSICSMPVQPTLSTTTLLRTTTAADGKLLQRRFSATFNFLIFF